jgi:hypothetical protein
VIECSERAIRILSDPSTTTGATSELPEAAKEAGASEKDVLAKESSTFQRAPATRTSWASGTGRGA